MPDFNTNTAGLTPVQPGVDPGTTAPVDSSTSTPTPETAPPVGSGQQQPQPTHAPPLGTPEPTTTQDLEQSTQMLYSADPAEAFNPDLVAQLAVQQSQDEYDNAVQERKTALSQQMSALSDQASAQRKAGWDAFASAMVMGGMSIAAGTMSGIGTIGAGGDTDLELSQGKVQMGRWSSFGDATKGLGTVGQGIATKFESSQQVDQTNDQKLATKAGDAHDAANSNAQKAESIRESLISVVQKLADAQSEAASTAARNV